MTKRYPCECSEMFVDIRGPNGKVTGRRRLPATPLHDCVYIRRRNMLIPQAEEVVCRLASNGRAAWTAAFSAAMDRLAAQEFGWAQGRRCP